MSGRLAGVAIEAAGEIDGELLCRLRVHPIDRGVERRARFARCAGAEHGVDEPDGAAGVFVELSRSAEPRRTWRSSSEFGCRSARGTYFENWHVSLLQDGEVCRRI